MQNTFRAPSLVTRYRRKFSNHDESGFTSAQFIILMGLTIMVLATFVNVLLIENMRTTTLSALRDAARAGTRTVDLRLVSDPPDSAGILVAEGTCEDRLNQSMQDIYNSSTDDADCEIGYDPATDRYFMKASISAENKVTMVPWASAFNNRLKDLSATFTPSEAAKQ